MKKKLKMGMKNEDEIFLLKQKKRKYLNLSKLFSNRTVFLSKRSDFGEFHKSMRDISSSI